MVDINVNELKNDLSVLSILIDEYEEIKLNLFNQLRESCINWQDGNSIEFDNKIYLEKQETEKIIQSLKDKKALFDYVYLKYKEIGKSVRCNLNNKSTLIRNIDNCYNQAINILNEFNKIDRSFSYPEQYSISLQREKIVSVKNKLSEIKSTTNSMFNKISSIEEAISARLKELEQVRINSFDYNF